jgi:hypothetical protein
VSRPGLRARVVAAFRRVVRAAPIVVDVVVAVARHGVLDIYRGTLRILAGLDRYPIFRVVNRLTRNSLPPRRSPFSSVVIDACAAPAPLVPGDEIPSQVHHGLPEGLSSQNPLTLGVREHVASRNHLTSGFREDVVSLNQLLPGVREDVASQNQLAPGVREDVASQNQPAPGFREDVVSQNQLTLVTVIEEGRANRVRAVMSAIDSYAKRLAPPGSLIGISTIHFVRWLVIDDGRRLMMVSDYDGSWESYIDEFAEMILSGLDAIWETALAYPPDGARDLPAFKRFLRSHQVPAEVFFSAYPRDTVLNIGNGVRGRAARTRTTAAG